MPDNILLEKIINDNRHSLQNRCCDADKGTYKKLLIIGGSCGMAGAPYFCGLSALRTGVGMVKFIGPEANRSVLQSLLPEAMYEIFSEETLEKSLKWADMVIAGPGLSQSEEAYSIMRSLCRKLSDNEMISRHELILFDADALNIIASGDLYGILEHKNVIITPHVGEMSRLTGRKIPVIKENRTSTAEAFAKKYGITAVLKDHDTAVSDTERTYEQKGIASCLSKAGSGDVLCGIIAGVKAVTGIDTFEAAVLGVYLHQLSGSLASKTYGENGTLAHEIADSIPDAARSI